MFAVGDPVYIKLASLNCPFILGIVIPLGKTQPSKSSRIFPSSSYGLTFTLLEDKIKLLLDTIVDNVWTPINLNVPIIGFGGYGMTIFGIVISDKIVLVYA